MVCISGSFEAIEHIAEPVEPRLPFASDMPDPGFEQREALWANLAIARPATLFGHRKTGPFEDVEVLPHRRSGDSQRRGEIGYRHRPPGHPREHGAAGWIAERVEYSGNGRRHETSVRPSTSRSVSQPSRRISGPSEP